MSSSWTVKSEAMTKRLCFGSTFCASFLMNSSNSTRPAQHWFDEQTQTTPPVFPTFLIQMTTKGPGQTKDIDVLHLRMCCSLTWSEIAIFVVFVLDHTIASKKLQALAKSIGVVPSSKMESKSLVNCTWPIRVPGSKLGSKWKIPKLRERPQNPCPSRIDGWNHSKGAPIWSPCHSAFSSRFHVMPQFHKTKQIGCVPVDPQKMYLQGCAMSCTKATYQKSPRLQLLNKISQFITCGTKHHRVANCKDMITQDRHQKQTESNSKWQNDPAKLAPRPSGRYIEGNQAK